MIQYLLFVSSPGQIEVIKKSMEVMNPTPTESISGITESYLVQHKLLKDIQLRVDLLSDVDGITPHLKMCHVDLLIYDERGTHTLEAIKAINQIHDDIEKFSQAWGPDFLFPNSRIAIILEHDLNRNKRSFLLGKKGVRDVFVKPKKTSQVLMWLQKILTKDLWTTNRTGVTLSGGAIEGFLYQLGVMHALNNALKDKSLYDCEVYSGVSSGSIGASLLACGIPTLEVIKSLTSHSETLGSFNSLKLFNLAGSDIAKGLAKNSLSWAGLSPAKWTEKFLYSIPTGFFRGDYLTNFFKTAIEAFHGEDRFRSLENKLFVGATDQDTYKHVIFNKEDHPDLEISQALRASSSLPPFFTPMEIDDRFYIDGQITRSCDLDVVVKSDCKLCIVIDPLKPYPSPLVGESNRKGGYYTILQTVKALVSTRFENTLLHVRERYPDVDFLVFQPNPECAKLMQGSPMRYRIRGQLIEMAYKSTIRQIYDRYQVYASVLTKYGFQLHSPEDLQRIEQRLWT